MKKGFICRVNSNKMNREEKKSIGKIIKALEALSAHPSPFLGRALTTLISLDLREKKGQNQ